MQLWRVCLQASQRVKSSFEVLDPPESLEGPRPDAAEIRRVAGTSKDGGTCHNCGDTNSILGPRPRHGRETGCATPHRRSRPGVLNGIRHTGRNTWRRCVKTWVTNAVVVVRMMAQRSPLGMLHLALAQLHPVTHESRSQAGAAARGHPPAPLCQEHGKDLPALEPPLPGYKTRIESQDARPWDQRCHDRRGQLPLSPTP